MITRRRLKNNPELADQMALNVQVEPKSWKSAIKQPHWKSAMEEEIRALEHNETWVLVPRPEDLNVVGSKWVFKNKFKKNGTLDRHKARLVAQGYTQIPGLDFGETFSPVIKHTTIRVILSLAVTKKWVMRQLDVKNAFLHGFLKEIIYMEQPSGFTDTRFPSHVCKLKRSLYGLKQAPRAWFERLSQFLLQNGFKCSKADSSLFVLHTHNTITLMLVYVDDIVLAGNNKLLLEKLISLLSKEFAIKDLGPLHYFLGLEINYLSNGIFISQTKYTYDLLCRTKMLDSTHLSTPIAVKPQEHPNDLTPVDPTTYRSIVGALQYLTFTRPDIVHAVNKVCQNFQAPNEANMRAVKRILRYLKGTIQFGIRYTSQSPLKIVAFCDADWAGCKDTRRSTTGYCVYIGANCVSWASKKQPTVSRSSAEAEYRAMASTVAEITWLTYLFMDIGLFLLQPPRILCDNQSALHMSKNPVFHARSKHIELDYHFVREKVTAGQLSTHYVPSFKQIADVFTKALSKFQFLNLRRKLGIFPLPHTSLRGDDKPYNQ